MVLLNMLGIPYRHYVQRFRNTSASSTSSHPRRRTRSLDRHTDVTIFVSERGIGPPLVMQRQSGWTTGSKIMAASAGVVLITGIILTLLTMNSSMHIDTYRPIVFTILGILCIIVGPMLVCRLVLNVYDRRLANEQRQFEEILAESSAASRNGPGRAGRMNRRQLAVEYLFGSSSRPLLGGRSNRRRRNSTGMLYWFPDEKLPSYNSAMNVANNEDAGGEGGGGANKHWAAKFFDYSNDPPPTYAEATTSSAAREPGPFSHDISPPPPLVDEDDETSTSVATISLHDEQPRSHRRSGAEEDPIAGSLSSNTITSSSPSEERIHSGWPRRPNIQTQSYDADVERMASEESDEEN